MLWTIAVVLVLLWALGLISGYTIGGFIQEIGGTPERRRIQLDPGPAAGRTIGIEGGILRIDPQQTPAEIDLPRLSRERQQPAPAGELGECAERMGDTRVWVLPNPSGLAVTDCTMIFVASRPLKWM